MNYSVFDYGGTPSSAAAMLRSTHNNDGMPTHTMRANDPSQPGPARYKEYERKREGFRRYLEQFGVLDMITNVLTNMHDNIDWSSAVPPNGLDVFRQLLLKGIDGHLPEEREILHMQMEVLDLQKANKMMQEELHRYREMHMQQQPRPSNSKTVMSQLEAKFEKLDTTAAPVAASSSSASGSSMQQQQSSAYGSGLTLAPPPAASSSSSVHNNAITPMAPQKHHQHQANNKTTPPSVSR